jgi:hypothetical protein
MSITLDATLHSDALPARQSDLQQLAATIRTAHGAAAEAANSILSHVLTAGCALIAAQQAVPKGQWELWLRHNCKLTERHARRYMALTRAYDASGHTVSGDLTDLSLRGLMRHLTPPEKRPSGERPSGSEKAKPSKLATKGVLSTLAWSDATIAERRHFLDGAGLASVREAMPTTWPAADAKDDPMIEDDASSTTTIAAALRAVDRARERYAAAVRLLSKEQRIDEIEALIEKLGLRRDFVQTNEGRDDVTANPRTKH